ncbi:MAG TPA: alkaline phosphatase family protein [Gemmatimonadaceae bacterium]|nr:alkaline phosphatase family protein [Gemmatimonadaceae bacterium]
MQRLSRTPILLTLLGVTPFFLACATPPGSVPAEISATKAEQPPRAERALPSADSVPTLVVFITIDQMRADYFDRFASQLTGGLARLDRGGALFTNAFQDHAITETAPGHATTLSGRFPRHTGIVINSAGVQDPQSPVIGAPSLNASPFRFRGGTLIDWIRAKDPRSRALSVSRKDRAAILPLGRAHQSVYWYDPTSGRFSTSTYYADTLPEWVRDFNARRLPQSYAGRSWTTLLDSGYAEPDSQPVENHGSDYTFPHVLPSDTAEAVRSLPDFPWMDDVTLQMALTGLRALDLGRGPQTDLLAISLSTTDAVGHRYGTDSRELHDQVLRVDRALGAFLDTLFALRDSSKIVIALTGDHGVAPTPEVYAARTGATARRIRTSTVLEPFTKTLSARGVDPASFRYSEGMLMVDRPVLERAGLDPDSLVDAFATEVKKIPGVRRADRYPDIVADSLDDPIARRWYHQIPPDFPVALVVTLDEHSVGSGNATGIHGSPYDYDANVPVLFYGPPFIPGRYTRFARVADLAPTLAWVTATRPTEKLDGEVLWEALKGGEGREQKADSRKQ